MGGIKLQGSEHSASVERERERLRRYGRLISLNNLRVWSFGGGTNKKESCDR
jgi:hypothetical protein